MGRHLAAGGPTDVLGPRGRAKLDQPARVGEAVCEIHLLKAKEVGLVEATDGLERFPTHQHAGAFDVAHWPIDESGGIDAPPRKPARKPSGEQGRDFAR